MDPSNPRILYAAIWQVRRTPWSLESGGLGSGIFKSSDGGNSWLELSDRPGMPDGIKGRIGISCSPARSERVWAIVEAKDGALLLSDDGGSTWETVSEERELSQRPWYYHHVIADPQDADTVWVLNLKAWKSTDAGKSFNQVTTPHGDNHDLWIDPVDPQRMIEGNDGGACVSFNGGDSWSTIYNQPTSQFYHVTTDTQVPYRVYGTQQDNSAISVPSRSDKGIIRLSDCYTVGNSESGHIQVRPDNPNVVYSGAVGSAPGGGGVLLRYDHSTAQIRIITVWPEEYSGWGPKDLKYRFQWTFPILISPHDSNVLYTAGNRLFRSTDEGSSWKVVSPDLTRNDRSKQEPSGGPITKDTTGAEHFCTIFALSESPHQQGLLWVGTDDGLIHLSRDDGETWKEITPPNLPDWATVATIELSSHDRATAYVAAFRYKLDDYRPYLFKTNDFGASWEQITDDLPENDFVRVIREDPIREGMLYAGTERGVYFSVDFGASWHSFPGNLPVVPIHDLAIRGDDLIAATHGRSFWITDGLCLLRQLSFWEASAVHLFESAITMRMTGSVDPTEVSGKEYAAGLGMPGAMYVATKPNGSLERRILDAGANPRSGVVLHYYLHEDPDDEITLSIYDGDGSEIRRFSSIETELPDGSVGQDVETPRDPVVPAKKGMNRFVWDMRYSPGVMLVDEKSRHLGPEAVPGIYQVRLKVSGMTCRRSVEIHKDPRIRVTQSELQDKFKLLILIRDKLSSINLTVNQLRSVARQVDEWVARAKGIGGEHAVAEFGCELKQDLKSIEHELVDSRSAGALNRLLFPVKLSFKIDALTSVVDSAESAPPQQAYEVYEDLVAQIDCQLEKFTKLKSGRLAEFCSLLREHEVPAIVPVSEVTPLSRIVT